jgi:chorismate mutase
MGEFESQEPGGVEDREAREEAFVEDVQNSAESNHINNPEMKKILERLWMNSSSTPDTEATKEQLH